MAAKIELQSLWMSIFLLVAASSLIMAENYSQNTTFVFHHFDTATASQITEIGDASVLQSKAIRLTNHSERVSGRAYYFKPVTMKTRNGSVISFSTGFIFSIVPHPRTVGAEGLCFIMTPTNSLNDAIASKYLGLVNMTSDGQRYNHLFAVEFDTIQNLVVEDKDSNHVGIDVNSVKSVEQHSAGVWEGNVLREINLKSGHNIRAWIDYDGESKKVDISIAGVRERTPQKALLSRTLDLEDVLKDEMYVGFSASSGHCFGSCFTYADTDSHTQTQRYGLHFQVQEIVGVEKCSNDALPPHNNTTFDMTLEIATNIRV